MARQLRVSPSAGQQTLIKLLADGWGQSEAEIVMDGFSRSQAAMMTEYEQFQRLQGVPESPLRTLLLRFAAGEIVPEAELALLAHDCGLSIDVLRQIRDCLVNEGGRHHAAIS